jgi:hypothetical protein
VRIGCTRVAVTQEWQLKRVASSNPEEKLGTVRALNLFAPRKIWTVYCLDRPFSSTASTASSRETRQRYTYISLRVRLPGLTSK